MQSYLRDNKAKAAMARKVQKSKRPKHCPSPYPAKRAKPKSKPAMDLAVQAVDPTMTAFKIEYLSDLPSEGDIAMGKLTEAQRKWIDKSEYIKSPFNPRGAKPGELDQRVRVTPYEEWSMMKKYANFVIQGETYSSEQTVFVRGDHTPTQDTDTPPDMKAFWVAKILQVRASNPQHVYALVTWLYWPDELPPPAKKSPDQIAPHGGKRRYHGDEELVASNYLDILDVLSFAGKADVVEWDEEGEDGSSIFGKYLYWRQTFCRETQALSKIREHCVCRSHYNPGILMYICDNPTCAKWFHKVCLTEYSLSEAFTKLKPELDTDALVAKKNLKANKPIYSTILAGAIEPAESQGAELKITIHDLRKGHKRTWFSRVKCPMCKTKITT